MGFIKGKTVEAVRYAPLGSPVVYRILNSEIAITPDIASLIEITKKRTTFVVKTNCYEA